MNTVVLTGVVSREPVARLLAGGAQVLSLELTTVVDQRNLSVPLSWSNPTDDLPLQIGDTVCVVGSVRTRFFRAGGSTQARTEVEVASLCRDDDAIAIDRQRAAIEHMLRDVKADE